MAINPLRNIDHQVIMRISPTTMTITPMMIPNTFDINITPFKMILMERQLAISELKVKVYLHRAICDVALFEKKGGGGKGHGSAERKICSFQKYSGLLRTPVDPSHLRFL